MKGCCIACAVICLVLILAVGIAFGVLWNSTPEKLGIADVKLINERSLTDLGIENFKFKEIVKGIRQLSKFESSSVLSNVYNPVAENQNALNNLNGSNIKQENSVNPELLLTTEAEYSKPYLKTYQDTTLAFLFDTALSISTSAGKNYFGALNKVSVAEVSIVKTESATGAKIVLKVPFAEESTSKLFPEYVLLTVFVNSNVSEYGRATEGESSIVVNDGNEVFTAIISKSLDSYLDNGLEQIKTTTTELFFKMINNLGCIASLGSATMGTDGSITGEPAYGIGGVENGKITFAVYYK